MGFLRLYLAVCVLLVHTRSSLLPWPLHDGYEAVQIFFMISGFYMSLVAPKYRSLKKFYASRFLRIFGPYWITLLFVVALSIGSGIFYGNWLELRPYVEQPLDKNGFSGIFIATVANLIIFFQDWVMFLKHEAGGYLAFTANFRDGNHPLFPYLLIPQAWSIALELSFYALFPFLNKLKSRYLFLVFTLSLFARFFTYQIIHLNTDPWNYRFFPFEIALFIAGMLSFRMYSNLFEPPDLCSSDCAL